MLSGIEYGGIDYGVPWGSGESATAAAWHLHPLRLHVPIK